MNKKKIATIGVVIATVILAGIAVFTAIRLYQLRQESVSPTAPESEPAAAECGDDVCTDPNLLQTGCDLDGTKEDKACNANSAECYQATCDGQAYFCVNGSWTTNRETCSTTGDTAIPLTCEVTFTLGATTPPTTTPTPSDSPTPTSTPTGTATATATPTTPPGGGTSTPEPALPDAGISFPTILSSGLGILIILGSLILIF